MTDEERREAFEKAKTAARQERVLQEDYYDRSTISYGYTLGANWAYDYQEKRIAETGTYAVLNESPMMVENITIDQRYVFEKRIKELEAKLATAREALDVYAVTNDTFPEYGDVARAALGQIEGGKE